VKLLLDTHVLLWWLSAQRLRPKAVAAISSVESDVWVSAATIWEMSIKSDLGKLSVPDDLDEQLDRHSFQVLPISMGHALAIRELPRHHADPFDRMLVAQARVEDLTVVTRDSEIPRYPVAVLRA
jgi:PIN domain nuclease of toxin-antitoxin system